MKMFWRAWRYPPVEEKAATIFSYISSLFLFFLSEGEAAASAANPTQAKGTPISSYHKNNHHRKGKRGGGSNNNNNNPNARRRHHSNPIRGPSEEKHEPGAELDVAEDGGRKRREVGAALVIIAVLSVIVYWNSLDGEFVHDDVVSIVRNPDVVRTNSAQGWWSLWHSDYWGMPIRSQYSHKSYRPLTILTFRINFWLAGGLSETVFHTTNVLIHVCVSLLVFFISLQSLKMTVMASFVAGLIFAVHPVHTEAVAGITGRSDALACLLMLASFLFYSKSIQAHGKRNTLDTREECKVKGGLLGWEVVASGIFGCAALLAKETGITVMGINIFYDLYIHMNSIKRLWTSRRVEQRVWRLLARVSFTVAVIILSLAARFAIMDGTLPRFSQQDNPAAHATSELTRLYTYAFLPVFNAWLMIYPYKLSYDWQMGSIPLIESFWDVRNLCSVLFYISYFQLFRLAFTKGRRLGWWEEGPRIFVSLLFISLPFLPASNLLFPVGFVAAERILYTPSVGICILTAQGIEKVHRNVPKLRKAVVLLSCLMIMSLGLKTWDRNFVWKSRESLFKSGMRENPFNAKVHYNYANLHKDSGDIETAVKHYKIAIKLWPTYASAYNNLGALIRDTSTAVDSFHRAIKSNPLHNGAHFNLGVTYMRAERFKEALWHLEECLRLDPNHVEALQYLGACYNALNKSHHAENVFQKLIRADLTPSKLHTNFGIFLQELGKHNRGLTSKALTHFLLALTKTSWDVQALVHAAKLAYQLGAEQLFQQLSVRLLNLKFDPSVGYLLATSYVEKGKLMDAQILFERLSEESDSYYKIHYTQLLMKVRRWTDAEFAVRGVGKNDPNHPISILLLARIYEKLNKMIEATELLNTAIDKFCPQEANLCAQFYSQLGNLMHTMKDFTEAANYYDMAIKFDPKSVQAHTNIGAIYHILQNYKQADHHYVAALELEPDNQVVMNNRKKLLRIQEEEEAYMAAAAVAAVTSMPKNHSHRNNNLPNHLTEPIHIHREVHHHPTHNEFHFSWR